jgi:hypothetical protein
MPQERLEGDNPGSRYQDFAFSVIRSYVLTSKLFLHAQMLADNVNAVVYTKLCTKNKNN